MTEYEKLKREWFEELKGCLEQVSVYEIYKDEITENKWVRVENNLNNYDGNPFYITTPMAYIRPKRLQYEDADFIRRSREYLKSLGYTELRYDMDQIFVWPPDFNANIIKTLT